MKRIFTKSSLVVFLATALIGISELFASMPCQGAMCEPKMPEELKK